MRRLILFLVYFWVNGSLNPAVGSFCTSTPNWNVLKMIYSLGLATTVPCVVGSRRVDPMDKNYEQPEHYDKEDSEDVYGGEDETWDDEDEELETMNGVGILGSMDNLTYWAMREEVIFELAETRLKRLKEEVKLLEEYVEDYRDSSGDVIEGAKVDVDTLEERGELIARSGIAAYRMTYRYVEMLQKIKEYVAEDVVDQNLHDILWDVDDRYSPPTDYARRHAGQVYDHWPNRLDLNYAKQAMIHIQEIHEFDFSNLPSELALETWNPPGLNAFHCKEIGLFALYKKQFDVAVIWIEEAIRKVLEDQDSSVTLASLEVYLELVANKHNDAQELTYAGLEGGTLNVFTTPVKPFNWDLRETLPQYYLRKGHKRSWIYSWENFMSLCSGREFQTAREKASMKCWYDFESHPYWRVNPLKKERLSFNPPVVQVYEFLGNEDIERILNSAYEDTDFRVSGIMGKHSYLERTKSRTSVNSWVPHGEIPKVEKKVGFLSGLDVDGLEASEMLQVVEYVYGRLYAPHPDSLQPYTNESNDTAEEAMRGMKRTGDRLMTVLFYLNDVPEGGSTPFCDAGVAARPVKGSAIMWENLYRNGSARVDTWHGACPVIYGHKIIANKWIRYNKQFQKYKCSLNQLE